MATAISYEAHTYSFQTGKLPGFPEDSDALKSLSNRLEAAIGDPRKYKSADDLIDAYIDSYRMPSNVKGREIAGAIQTNRIVQSLKAARKEQQAARLRATMVQAVKKLRQ